MQLLIIIVVFLMLIFYLKTKIKENILLIIRNENINFEI